MDAPRVSLFISDLHLSPLRPAPVAAFHALCAGTARAAAGLYVLGDLFDAWFGDDQLREPLPASVVASLKGVADAGVPVFFLAGNRDFLTGERFAHAAGATILPEQTVVDLYGTPTLLLHGDELCTDDLAYQRYRARMRSSAWRGPILAFPYSVRRSVAALLRRMSRKATAAKTESIMDVNGDAVAAAFRAHGVTRMIHGHTHRPAHHSVTIDGRPRDRYVLADWYEHGSYLAVDANGAHAHEIDPAV